MVCPMDKPSCEFRMRPDLVLDKGTGAQRRPVLSPDTLTETKLALSDCLQRKFFCDADATN